MGNLARRSRLAGTLSIAVLAFGAATWAACTPLSSTSKSNQATGASCDSNNQCASGACYSNTCAPKSCSCAQAGGCSSDGTQSSDCANGELCVHSEPSDLGRFLGDTASDSCITLCGGPSPCPMHYTCPDAGGQKFCAYDTGWDKPKLVIDSPANDGGEIRVAAGQAIRFHATAASAAGDTMTKYTWGFPDDGTEVDGQEVTHTFVTPTGSAPVHARVSVFDTHQRSSEIFFDVEVCPASGC